MEAEMACIVHRWLTCEKLHNKREKKQERSSKAKETLIEIR